MKVELLFAAFAGACHVQAQAVFAHFMVGNTAKYTEDTWRTDIRLAKEAHIDAFALNMAHGESVNEVSLERAFNAAKAEGFKLLFSFDYAGQGPWPKDTVISYLKKYASTGEYFKHSDGKPLVSTFEGPENANDWIDIKSQVGCFFMPDWSSKGARPALELANGVADGLFNWAAWPWGTQDMDTYVDASYYHYLSGKPYMMPVSPWFYTNLPGYNKNWMWRGDDLWHDRWIQVIYNKPAYVQIISWNDYGESHYIGPLYDHAMEAFVVGKAPFNYASNMPHDGWRLTLPFWIDYYKSGKATITQEGLVAWYRKSPSGACGDGNTVGNTASQLQLEFPPTLIMQNEIFFSAVLAATAEVTVTVGGTTFYPKWISVPDGGVGVYHGSVYLLTETGDVNIQLSRGNRVIARVEGVAYSSAGCHDGLTNWNAWVGSAVVPGSVSATTPRSRNDQGCVKGTGAKGFVELCEFLCKYDYCPVSACLCQAVGAPNAKPPALQKDGFPAKGKSESYMGLCSNACNLGFCPETYCSPTPQEMIVPTVSEFLPPACRRGRARPGHEPLAGLCSYACDFGFCPLHVCTCDEQGGLVEPPPKNPDVTGTVLGGINDEKLCDFACSRGWCPDDICKKGTTTTPPSDPPSDPEDTCSKDDITFKAESMRAGSHYPIALLDAETVGASDNQYITIVNLTPYRFKYLRDASNWFQVRPDFDDIPPGHSRQCVMEYAISGVKRVDDKGEAYFEVEGTNRQFAIKARTHIPHQYPRRTIIDLYGLGLGAREYEDPEKEASVTFVITGSESYGYHHSLTWESTKDNWMRSIYDAIKDRELRHVVMPGTHDSGMSKIGKYMWGGTEMNTRNQGVSIYWQLKAGARWFDLRPSRVPATDDGEFHIFHVASFMSALQFGASGVTLRNVIDDVNKFTSESSGEVIILWMGNIVQFISSGGNLINATQTAELFAALEKINNRCPNLGKSPKFGERKMSEFMSKNNDHGCVLIMLDQMVADGVPSGDKPAEGIYRGPDYLPNENHWAEAESPEELIDKQTKFFTNTIRERGAGSPDDKVIVAQFQLTPAVDTSNRYGLEAMAVLPTNPALYWGGVAAMSPQFYPNVIMQDYFGVRLIGEHGWDSLGAEARVLAMGLNLYMASENCKVNKRKHPLLKKSNNRLPAPWNGIIFANGTVMDSRPAHYDPWRNPVLRAGTVFGNGTVLTRNITNPFH